MTYLLRKSTLDGILQVESRIFIGLWDLGKESFKAQMLPGISVGEYMKRRLAGPCHSTQITASCQRAFPKNANIYKIAAEPRVLKIRHLIMSASWKWNSWWHSLGQCFGVCFLNHYLHRVCSPQNNIPGCYQLESSQDGLPCNASALGTQDWLLRHLGLAIKK